MNKARSLKINKVIETCIYSDNIESMKDFYVNLLGLPLVSEENDKLIFLKAGQSMLSIFNPSKTSVNNASLPTHGITFPTAGIHFALEVSSEDFDSWKNLLADHKINIESEVSWKGGSRSIYFRDPARNLVELITPGQWPVD